MCSGQDILKLSSLEEFLTKNWTGKAVLVSSNEQNKFAHLVLNWLPDFDWEMDIVPLLSHLVAEGIFFVENTRISDQSEQERL